MVEFKAVYVGEDTRFFTKGEEYTIRQIEEDLHWYTICDRGTPFLNGRNDVIKDEENDFNKNFTVSSDVKEKIKKLEDTII